MLETIQDVGHIVTVECVIEIYTRLAQLCKFE